MSERRPAWARWWVAVGWLGLVYLVASVVLGIVLMEGALRPGKRAGSGRLAASLDGEKREVEVVAKDGIHLRGLAVTPRAPSGSTVILLHGAGGDRDGVNVHAGLLLAQGCAVLLPDSRGHGTSDGMATYGVREADDVAVWVDWLIAEQKPRCVFGLGESMGAAILLQSLRHESRFCAVIAEAPFWSFREVGYDRLSQAVSKAIFRRPDAVGPWLGRTLLRPVVGSAFLYARWRYDLDFDAASPKEAVRASLVPILLIRDGRDDNITARHIQAIMPGVARGELWQVPAAGHTAAISTDRKGFERRVKDWFSPERWQREAPSRLAIPQKPL